MLITKDKNEKKQLRLPRQVQAEFDRRQQAKDKEPIKVTDWNSLAAAFIEGLDDEKIAELAADLERV